MHMILILSKSQFHGVFLFCVGAPWLWLFDVDVRFVLFVRLNLLGYFVNKHFAFLKTFIKAVFHIYSLLLPIVFGIDWQSELVDYYPAPVVLQNQSSPLQLLHLGLQLSSFFQVLLLELLQVGQINLTDMFHNQLNVLLYRLVANYRLLFIHHIIIIFAVLFKLSRSVMCGRVCLFSALEVDVFEGGPVDAGLR